jgi:hypothetical protein
LIGTSIRNQYKIEYSDLKQKNLLQETEKIDCNKWSLSKELILICIFFIRK